LVVEILSPFNSRTDKVTKKNTYLEFGVNEYWIVDPFEKNIMVYTPSSGQNAPSHTFTGKDKVSSPNFPTLTFDLDKIFPE
jgi:Uma2 family endonuclease